jgi:hypothetical protein
LNNDLFTGQSRDVQSSRQPTDKEANRIEVRTTGFQHSTEAANPRNVRPTGSQLSTFEANPSNVRPQQSEEVNPRDLSTTGSQQSADEAVMSTGSLQPSDAEVVIRERHPTETIAPERPKDEVVYTPSNLDRTIDNSVKENTPDSEVQILPASPIFTLNRRAKRTL